jgi:class 3 adenylate cyclase/predicted ATPase
MRSWLEEQGLGEYADAFEQNDVGLDLLPQLTDDELRQLGVDRIGHRVRLRKAIAALQQTPPSQTVAEPRSPRPPAPAPAPAPTHALERRQVTVMFCDMVGSTALAQRLEPEDLRGLMQAYQQACATVIERYGGHVAQYLGDGLMVYFGWPQAFEDNARRAVLAALEICDAVGGIAAPEPVRVRIGIATGPVMVGESGEGDASVPKAAIGETPNVAARVQGEAGPGEIVIAASTHSLTGGAFEYAALGERRLKGIAEAQRCWRVLGASEVYDRFEAGHAAGLSPLIGRERELDLLMNAWSQVLDRQGRVVVLSGEPGIGKSRLVQAFRNRVDSEALLIHFQCSPYHAHSAFYPITKQLERDADIRPTDAPAERLDKLDRMLSPLAAALPSAPALCAALLSLPLDRYPPLNMSPQRQRAATIEVFTETALRLAQTKPVLMIVEDAHWMDPSSFEAFSALVKAIPGVAVLLVLTQRPELEPSSIVLGQWMRHDHVVFERLARLSPQGTAELIANATGGKTLPAAVQQQIMVKCDGIPLFCEELTRNVLASGQLESSNGGYVLRGSIEHYEVPATLKDLLAARLDQLRKAKRVAQIGAVLGREFRHDLLQALAGKEASDLADACEELLDSGLAAKRGSAPDVVYVFRHALIQDAAYDSLLKSEQRALHRRCGDLLVERFPEFAQREPEVIARHYTVAGVHEKAVQYWLAAGGAAWQRSAAQDAIVHLRRGIELLPGIEDSARREALELRLQATLGLAHFAAMSYVSPEAQAAYLRAHELCARVSAPELQFPVLYGIGAFQTMKGEVLTGHDTFEELMTVARSSGKPRFLLYAHTMLAWSNYNRAEFRAAVEHADRALELYDEFVNAGPRISAADPKVISERFRAAALWSLGYADQAQAASEGLLRHARALGDPYSLAYTLNGAGLVVPDLSGQYDRVLELTQEGIALAEEHDYISVALYGTLYKAWALGRQGDVAAALDLMEHALGRHRDLGARFHNAQLLARQGMLLAEAGQVERARCLAAEAVRWGEQSGETSVQADVLLLAGAVWLASDGIAEAERYFTEAVQTARAQGAKGYELRAATALARLWHGQGRGGEAQALLAPVCAWFVEGLDSPDMQQAKRLLAALS